MRLNFPSNPSLNDTHTHNGVTWTFNGIGWSKSTSSVSIGNYTSNIIPESNILYTLGNVTNRWKSIYLGADGLDIEGVKISKDSEYLSIVGAGANVTITPNVASFLSNISISGGSTSSIIVSDTAPSNASDGNQWFNSNTGDLGVYYSNSWVAVGGGGSSIASTTELAEGDNLYFTNTRAVEAFTAGQSIVIEANGLISANVSSGTVTVTDISDQVNTSNGYLAIPTGNIAQRSNSPENGHIRYNTETGFGEIYNATVGQWLSFGTSPSVSVEYFVLGGGGGAGGGTGGVNYGSGGAAGVIRASTLTSGIQINTPYTVTVGAGGAGVTGTNSGASGSSSVFSSVTATGGNGAGTGFPGANNADFNGAANGGGGTAAGGGAGAGGNGVNSTGGVGVSNSISGTATFYGGGGGGGPSGPGGNGGGGNGVSSGNGGSGTANRGGGGGGANSVTTGGSGGSGIVILKYLDSYTATFSGGLTTSTTTSGGYKISTVTAGTGTVTFAIG